jgi:hypothetical protein
MCVRKKTNTANVLTIEKSQQLALNEQAYCEGLTALGVSPKHLLLLGFK